MHVTIKMRRPGEAAWSILGNFAASDDELTELQELLHGGDDPFEVLDCISNQLIFDTLDILRADGYQARLTFHEDN